MIKFWRTTGKYGPFSNFYRCEIFIDGCKWKSTEHYYQAQKTTDLSAKQSIQEAKTPKEAKTLAGAVPLREDWEEVKYDVMKKALLAKFQQHTSLKELLLSTEGEEIAEDSPYDAIWGLGRDGTGKNLLGKCLMEVRECLKHKQEYST